jgi:hypothetical protein
MKMKNGLAVFTLLSFALSCRSAQPPTGSSIPSASGKAAIAQVYYWKAKPGMLTAYNRYIRDVAEPIDEEARHRDAFLSVTTLQSRDTLGPFTHMRIFLLRDSAQHANLGAALNAAGMRLEPDSTKRRERSTYAATLRDAAGSAVLDVIR